MVALVGDHVLSSDFRYGKGTRTIGVTVPQVRITKVPMNLLIRMLIPDLSSEETEPTHLILAQLVASKCQIQTRVAWQLTQSVGASENGDESFGSLVQPKRGLVGAEWGGEHGQQVGPDSPHAAPHLGENGFVELAHHDGQPHEPVQVVGVPQQFLVVGAAREGGALVLDPDIFNSVVVVVGGEEAEQLVGALPGDVLALGRAYIVVIRLIQHHDACFGLLARVHRVLRITEWSTRASRLSFLSSCFVCMILGLLTQ